MKKNFTRTALLLLLPLTLTACDQEPSASADSLDSFQDSAASQDSVPTSWDTEESAEGFYLPGKAPRDYEGKDFAYANRNPKDAYFFIDHKMTNSDYVSKTTGAVSVSVTGIGSMVQNLSSFNIKVGDDSLNHAVALSSQDGQGPLSSLNFNSSTVSFENPFESKYYQKKYSSKIKADFAKDSDGFDQVVNWGNSVWNSFVNSAMFLEQTGKNAYSFSNYYVPDESAILTARATTATPNKLSMTFTFNTDSDNGTDASKYYINQMANMVPIPGLSVSVDSLQLDVDMDSEWNVVSMKCTENYSATIIGFTCTISNVMETEFTMLDDGLDDVTNTYMKSIWDEAYANAFPTSTITK